MKKGLKIQIHRVIFAWILALIGILFAGYMAVQMYASYAYTPVEIPNSYQQKRECGLQKGMWIENVWEKPYCLK